MIITETKSSQINDKHITALYGTMLENGDNTRAEKLLQIYEKWKDQELMISFAGHFSAGKSSMINHLLGKSILPKSPIPTSANVVKIKSGKGAARIYLDNGALLEYEEPYNIDMIKAYATNKASIQEIEIHTTEADLPDGCTIIDTPGIDAADDADRLITESSLHLVDTLVYVMDYNHVQSEVNLHFLKKVQDYKLPFYVIINQVDKHDEQELAFQDFTQKIHQTFDQWGIFPEIIYYSSLINCYAPHNQIDDIKMKLFSMMNTAKYALLNIGRSVNQVVKEHKEYLQQLYEEEAADAGLQNDKDILDVMTRLDELHADIAHLNSIPDRAEEDFHKALNATLKNAYLMPADLRDTAQWFLESQQRDFKVGLLASKKRTAEERHKRRTKFVQDLQPNIEAAIQWKLRDKLLHLLHVYKVHDQELTRKIQNMSITYDASSLTALIKPGAKVNGDYVLHYTNDVSADVKQKFKQEALYLWDAIYKKIAENTANELSAYTSERDQLEQVYHQQKIHEQLMNDLHGKIQQIDNMLTDPEPESYGWDLIDEALTAKHEPVRQSVEPLPVQKNNEPASVKRSDQVTEKSSLPVDHILADLAKTIETISDLPGFQSLTNDLTRKYDRLDNRTYTIALFGAFSAGKSSFANALMGEKVLPAAPNPTTAAINRINPVTEAYEHGTVVAKLKDEASLVDDVKSLISPFSPETEDLGLLLDWIMEHSILQHDQLPETHQAYLTAILQGYHHNRAKIGQEITIDLNEFTDYVTDETKACYLESVDLYYDCSVTRKGITLVDTPGADSINARHTNVAFDYMKHADAIFYVTYYNHAFSRADKDFLIQLGRVKDAFQLDKMFFIMNASDLAENDAERHMVQQYIQEELTALGIRFPRLFPVSSKQSLDDKRNNKVLNDQMKDFEGAFDYFIHDELASMTIQSAVRDIQRTRQALHHYQDSIKLNAAEKERVRTELLEKQTFLKQLTAEMDTDIYQQKIIQKLEKQLYYVLERLSIRFHDLFKETFNPTTITGSGKQAQQQLADCLRNLLDYAGYELLQELRAVSLRIESFIDDLKEEVYLDYTNKSTHIDDAFLLPDFEASELTTPDYEQAFLNLDVRMFEKELKQFNGTRAFFAKNEKEIMKERLLNHLYPFAEHYIAENKKKMGESYHNQWNGMLDTIKRFINQNIENYIENQLDMISDQAIDVQTLNEKHDILVSILIKYEEMNLS
ncbi:Dynamin family protein [Lentibacillus halodurans]|uniref:Dynamin family protein n=1 Tax=Lentibacillus halodurans TaxID=237679 RepID=A0A1I0VGF9_9BACI|nr:dynamin family protein [Lentibacillus halodurans]SFA75117.1 Dynamin family protein [Lentibacillus halodurans]